MKIRISKKAITLIVAAALLIALAVGGTVAYLQADTTPVTNTFIPGEVSCEVVRTDSADAISSAAVKNTGNVPAFIRVSVTGNAVNAEGYLTGNADLSAYLAGSGWTKGSDGFYYYGTAVEPGASTGGIFTGPVPLDGILVTVLAEAIQADGMGATSAQQAFQIAKGGA